MYDYGYGNIMIVSPTLLRTTTVIAIVVQIIAHTLGHPTVIHQNGKAAQENATETGGGGGGNVGVGESRLLFGKLQPAEQATMDSYITAYRMFHENYQQHEEDVHDRIARENEFAIHQNQNKSRTSDDNQEIPVHFGDNFDTSLSLAVDQQSADILAAAAAPRNNRPTRSIRWPTVYPITDMTHWSDRIVPKKSRSATIAATVGGITASAAAAAIAPPASGADRKRAIKINKLLSMITGGQEANESRTIKFVQPTAANWKLIGKPYANYNYKPNRILQSTRSGDHDGGALHAWIDYLNKQQIFETFDAPFRPSQPDLKPAIVQVQSHDIDNGGESGGAIHNFHNDYYTNARVPEKPNSIDDNDNDGDGSGSGSDRAIPTSASVNALMSLLRMKPVDQLAGFKQLLGYEAAQQHRFAAITTERPQDSTAPILFHPNRFDNGQSLYVRPESPKIAENPLRYYAPGHNLNLSAKSHADALFAAKYPTVSAVVNDGHYFNGHRSRQTGGAPPPVPPLYASASQTPQHVDHSHNYHSYDDRRHHDRHHFGDQFDLLEKHRPYSDGGNGNGDGDDQLKLFQRQHTLSEPIERQPQVLVVNTTPSSSLPLLSPLSSPLSSSLVIPSSSSWPKQQQYEPPQLPPINQPDEVKLKAHVDTEQNYAADYEFGYRVRDFNTGNDFGHTQKRNEANGITTGEYHILMPNGKVQYVVYKADENGFHANVSYEEMTGPPAINANTVADEVAATAAATVKH